MKLCLRIENKTIDNIHIPSSFRIWLCFNRRMFIVIIKIIVWYCLNGCVFERNECQMKMYFNFNLNLFCSIKQQQQSQIMIMIDEKQELFECIYVEGITCLLFSQSFMKVKTRHMCCSVLKHTIKNRLNIVQFLHSIQHILFSFNICVKQTLCIVSFTENNNCIDDILRFLSQQWKGISYHLFTTFRTFEKRLFYQSFQCFLCLFISLFSW